MNVVIVNKNANIINNLGINVIKNMSGEFSAEEIVSSFSTFFYNRMIIDITSIRNYKNIGEIKKIALGLDPSKIIILLDESKEVNDFVYISCLVTMGIYNFTKNCSEIINLINKPNTYNDVAYLQKDDPNVRKQLEVNLNNVSNVIKPSLTYDRVKIIGFRNVTYHAGATTLIYMLKNFLKKKYRVKCLEIDKEDFSYFNDSDMESITNNDVNMLVPKYSDYQIILIDLNESGVDGVCNDIVYLLEPSTIKLNRMINEDKDIFKILEGRKIVINQSLLNDNEVKQFEIESGSKVFYNLPPLDDKIENDDILSAFVQALGIM